MPNYDVMSETTMTNSMWPRLMRGKMHARKNLALLLAGLLIGCVGGDEGDNEASSLPPSPVGAVSVMDGFGTVRPDTATQVDLSAFIRGQGATLTTMESTQSECRAANFSGLTAEVTIKGGGLCEYTFTASNSASHASAALNVLASSKASPVLPPLSQAMTLAVSSATYDLQSLLGADWPSGYSLDANSLQVQGGSVQGIATASGNNIIYTPPVTPDWNRIVFILKDPNRPTEDALGTLYITVSDEVNQAPVIGKPKYDYKAETGTEVATSETNTLDLATLPALGISDPDGGGWQLVEVQSYSASVTPVDPNSVFNKQFTFSAGTVGTHIVSYIVGDHEGGFAMGMMNITVGPKEYDKDWVNIVVGDITFYATPLHSEVSARGVTAEGIWDNGVNLASNPPGNTIGGVTGAGARSYCSGSGHRLATQANLDTLRTTSAVSTALIKYPKQRNYLVSNVNGGNYLVYDLNNGVTGPYVSGTTPNQYVICVKYANDGKMTYIPTANTPFSGYTNTAISDGVTWWTLGNLVSDGGASPELTVIDSAGTTPLGAENVRLYPAGCSGGSCTLEANASLTQFGSASVRLTNASDPGVTLDINPVRFWQDAKLTALRTGTNSSIADGVAENTLIASLKRNDGSTVPSNTKVKLTYSSSPATGVTVTPASGSTFTTNGSGEVALTLRYNNNAGGTVMVSMDPVVDGLPGNAQSVGSVFAQVPPLVVCNSVTSGGLTYTCPLTKGEADANGVSYASTYTENGSKGPAGKTFIRQMWSQADTYCSNLGSGYRLASRDELSALYSAKGNMFSAAGWPASFSYWSSTVYSAGDHHNVRLTDGNVGYVNDSYGSYVSCVKPASPPLPNFDAGCTQGTVTVNGLTYTCPLTKGEADANGVAYESTYAETGYLGPTGKTFILQTWPQANTYCSNLGNGYRLANRYELSALHSAKGNMFSAAGWPASDDFWSSSLHSASNHYTVSLVNGVVIIYGDSWDNYVSCVKPASPPLPDSAGCDQDTVTVNGRTYTCPLTKGEADAKRVAYTSTRTEDGTYGPAGETFIRQTWSQANTYCSDLSNGYSLASRDELSGLYSAKGNMYSAAGWPTGSNYWSSTAYDASNHDGVSLVNGYVGIGYHDSSNFYVSCVRSGS